MVAYSDFAMNSSRLAEILRHEAALLEHIVTDQRYYPDYFRVAFFGTFPDAIRNKQFIVRAQFVMRSLLTSLLVSRI